MSQLPLLVQSLPPDLQEAYRALSPALGDERARALIVKRRHSWRKRADAGDPSGPCPYCNVQIRPRQERNAVDRFVLVWFTEDGMPHRPGSDRCQGRPGA